MLAENGNNGRVAAVGLENLLSKRFYSHLLLFCVSICPDLMIRPRLHLQDVFLSVNTTLVDPRRQVLHDQCQFSI